MFGFITYKKNVVLLVLLFGFCLKILGQNDSISGLQQLDKLIENNKYTEAEKVLTKQVDNLIERHLYYEATDYVYYKGKIAAQLKNSKAAEKSVLEFAKQLSGITNSGKVLRQLQLEIGAFYESIGNNQKALECNQKALEYTKQMPNAMGQDYALIHSNISVFYSRTGNYQKALSHLKQSYSYYKKDPTTKPESFYSLYNSMGGIMWYASKIDSALVYYKKADSILITMPPTPWNKYYRTALP